MAASARTGGWTGSSAVDRSVRGGGGPRPPVHRSLAAVLDRAAVDLACGHPHQARARLRAWEPAAATLADHWYGRWLAEAAEGAAAAGDLGEHHDLRRRLEALAARGDDPWLVAAVDRARAHQAPPDPAARWRRLAADRFLDIGDPLDAGRTLIVLAEHLPAEAIGARREAAIEATHALAMTGHLTWMARAQALLGRVEPADADAASAHRVTGPNDPAAAAQTWHCSQR